MTEKLYNPEEVAEYLGIAEKTVRDYLRSGKLTGSKVGRYWRIRERDVQAFLDKNSTEKQ